MKSFTLLGSKPEAMCEGRAPTEAVPIGSKPEAMCEGRASMYEIERNNIKWEKKQK